MSINCKKCIICHSLKVLFYLFLFFKSIISSKLIGISLQPRSQGVSLCCGNIGKSPGNEVDVFVRVYDCEAV